MRRIQGGGARAGRGDARDAASGRIAPAGGGNGSIAPSFRTTSFTRSRVLRRFFDLEVGQGGDGTTVNVGSVAQDGSFEMVTGRATGRSWTSARSRAACYVHTTGQSGNVFDRHYRDLLPEWRAGRYFEIGTEPAADVLILQSP